MKLFMKWLLKAFVAGCIAFALLCGFCLFWYNVPVHYENPTGATEYVWEKSSFYSKAIEGFAWGRTNNEGHNNLKDYNEGDRVDILLMGSSHMEGFNVAQDENAAAVLNQLFEGEKYCYNIGTAGHTLPYCIKNLGDALERYEPTEYVILEAFNVDFGAAELKNVADGTLADIPSHSGGIIGMMQKLPYLRLFYTQHFKDGGQAFDALASAPAQAEDPDYAQQLDRVLDIVANECSEHGITPIIAHNTNLLIAEDGSCYTDYKPEKQEIFSLLCEEKGIVFIDAVGRFMAEYENSNRLPYGFSNTSPGAGHMNKLGHRLFAEEIYAAIQEMEG